jgi:hypothetical protein
MERNLLFSFVNSTWSSLYHELAALMPVEGTPACADVYEGKKVLQSLDIPI